MQDNLYLKRNNYIQQLISEGYQWFFPDIEDFASESDNVCFGCSKTNDIGLKMEFYTHLEHDHVITPMIIQQKYCGYPIFTHGGIQSTLIDEIMSHTINFRLNTFAVTRSIQLDFFKPVLINKPILIIGKVLKIIQKSEKRVIETLGEIRAGFNINGEILTSGKGIWIEIPKTQLVNMKLS